MATVKKQTSTTPVTPDFRDLDKEATTRAQAALAGGRQDPLKVPKTAKVSVDQKTNTKYSRWPESAQITSAYRSVTASGLMDVTIIGKIRQSAENTGKKVFAHFYLNMGAEIPEGHDLMNDRSNGAILSLLQSTGFAPTSGVLKASILNKMFPPKSQPGVSSPLQNKVVTVNIVQQEGPQKDRKTKKVVLDADGEVIIEKRDNAESFTPPVSTDAEDESEGEEE